jgi:murein DD-endopeptidase MepM/ murein hydrolase activator NlpD
VGYNQVFGNYIIVNHADGMQSLYGHLSRQDVRIGQAISQGQAIGLSGNTGYSTAAHLHLGIYRGGSSVNPLKYLK